MHTRRPSKKRLQVEELENRLVPATVLTSLSTNWSGFAVTAANGSFSAVAGSWVVPSVTGAGTSYSSFWVGIDGFNSPTVEQIGTDSDITNGVPTYYAWYEMYPQYPVDLKLKVQPGDSISANVTYSAANQFTLQITDTPVKGSIESFSTTQTLKGADRSSAEVIAEAPSSNSGVLPLSNFSSVSFSAASATLSTGTKAALDGLVSKAQVNQINMIYNTGATAATTSALKDSGSPATSAFTVSFTPPPPVSPPPARHFVFYWWLQTNIMAVEPTGAGLSSAAGALAAGSPNATFQLPASTFMPAAATQPTAIAPVNLPVSPMSPLLPQLSGSGQVDVDGPDDDGDLPAMPPAAKPPGAFGNQPASQVGPGVFLIPPQADDTASMPGTAVLNRACDACFMEEDAAFTSSEQVAGALIDRAEEAGTPIELGAGLVLAFVLSGASDFSTEGDGRKRRRWLRAP